MVVSRGFAGQAVPLRESGMRSGPAVQGGRTTHPGRFPDAAAQTATARGVCSAFVRNAPETPQINWREIEPSAVSAALRGLLSHLLDGCQSRVPPCGGSCQGGAGLIEAFLANGVANFAAASVGRDETVALEDGEVFGDPCLVMGSAPASVLAVASPRSRRRSSRRIRIGSPSAAHRRSASSERVIDHCLRRPCGRRSREARRVR